MILKRPHWPLASFLVVLLAVASFPAFADDDELDRLLLDASASRHAVDGFLRGQRVRAVPLLSWRGRCPRVGLLTMSVPQRAASRVATYDLCQNDIIDTGELAPALPDDARARTTGQDTMRAAARYGQRSTGFNGYVFDAVRLTRADASGCAQVETTVSYEGLLVANSVGKICPD
jgi:hypothetical protein